MKRSVEHDHHDRAGGRHPHEAPPDHAARAAAEGHDDQAEPAGHAAHAAHADHAGHSPEAFRGRFWVSLLLTLPVLYLSEQLQAWFGYRAVSFPGSGWVNPLLGTALFLYGGLVFLRGARAELAARRPGMMTLVSLAITVAYAYSMAVAFGAPGMPFFWELGTLVVIMLLGHWLETASVQGASRALADLASLVPHVAHRVENGAVEDVPVAGLRHGDHVLVRPGEQLPADGRVVEGRSSVNVAFLTGESRPVPKAAGDEVLAGAVNGEGALTVAVARTGGETTLSQVQRLVEEAQASRGRFQRLADRAAGWLFYVALGAGALTFVAWLLAAGEPQQAIARAVTVLVIACPHALGLAIPLVTVNATAMSAANGILVRDREAFERARDIGIVAFDKTGTLTEGRFGVASVHAEGVGAREALALAAALETRSEHPLARAVVEEASARGLDLPRAEAFEVVAGMGVRGRVEGAEDPVPSCSGEVVDRSGCDTRHPHRVAGRIGQDLDVAAVPAMFARVPEVVAGIGTLPAPGRGDQGAVEADVFPPGFDPVGEDVVQVRGMGGDHVDTFVEIAVGGGLRDPRVAGECCDVGTVPEPAQHHHRLDVDGRGPLPRPVVGSLAVRGQDAGDEGQGVLGHVERGTIGDHVGSCFGIASWSKRSLPGGIPRPHLTPRCPALHGRCQTHPGEKTSLSQVVDYSKTGRSVRGRCISKKYGYEIQFTTAS